MKKIIIILSLALASCRDSAQNQTEAMPKIRIKTKKEVVDSLYIIAERHYDSTVQLSFQMNISKNKDSIYALELYHRSKIVELKQAAEDIIKK